MVNFWDQEVKGQGHMRMKIDLEARLGRVGFLVTLTLYGHVKTAEQWTIIAYSNAVIGC